MGDYRNEARRELKRAEAELASGGNDRLKYAALELRMAMESLTYDRALAYKDEFPAKEYETWQPRRVMTMLLEIDPNADKDSSLAVGIEPSYGETPEVMQSLGSEKVLNLATLKEHYDALGSYLHKPTLKQQQSGGRVDFAKLRARCERIASYLGEVLASRVWNSTIGNFASIDCMKCGKPIRKRFPHGATTVDAKCLECGASYKVHDVGNHQANFEPDQVEVQCANSDCAIKIYPWRTEIEHGVSWICEECGGRNVFRLAIYHEPVGDAPPKEALAEDRTD